MSRPKTIDPESRRAIVTHALSSFARRGYAAVSIREITEAAGVTQPMLYYYFKNKEELYRTLLAQSFEELERLLAAARTHEGTARERLIKIVNAYFQFCLQNPERVRFMNRTFADDEQMIPAIDCEAYIYPRFQEIESVIADGQKNGEFGPCDSQEVAVTLMGMIRTYADRQLKCEERVLTHERAERIVGLFVDGNAMKGGHAWA